MNKCVGKNIITVLAVLGCLTLFYILLGNSFVAIVKTGIHNIYINKMNGIPIIDNSKRNRTNRKTLVLFWNRPSDWHHKFDKCEYNNCEFTDNRSDFYKSEAVLYHAPTVYIELNQMPKKTPGQIWVYMSQEPPSEVFTSYRKWRNVFNWTWTNRRDSDIFDPYGEITLTKKSDKLDYQAVFKNKSISAFWYVSHCKTEGRREDYVKILKNYIDIDIYGKCANIFGNSTKPPKRENKSKHTIGKIYKFYLAFENSLCRDYITEKALHIVFNPMIPVVRGEPNVELFLPPGSYIDAKHFQAAKHLGKYLQELENNETEYVSYFNWRRYYTAFQTPTRGICHFCKLLTQAQKHRALYDDIHAWVNEPGGKPLCNKNPQDI